MTYLGPKLAGMEDEREAKRAVKKLAESKKHLVRTETKDERPPLSRIFQSEQQTNQQAQQPMSPQVQQAQAERQFAEGLAAQLKKFTPEHSDSWFNAGPVG